MCVILVLFTRECGISIAAGVLGPTGNPRGGESGTEQSIGNDMLV